MAQDWIDVPKLLTQEQVRFFVDNGYLYPQKDHDNADEFDFAQESFGFNEKGEIPVEVKAGSVVFFNGYLLHRSRKNRSNTYRRVLVNHYMNAYSHLPWQIKPGEHAAMADRRVIVPVSGTDPYAWKGLEQPPKSVWLRTCKANAAATDPKADHQGKDNSKRIAEAAKA